MERFIRFTIGTYVAVGAFFMFASPEILPDFYRPRLMGSLAFISAALIAAPIITFKHNGDTQRGNALRRLQSAIAAGLLINGAGGLGLYKLYKVGVPYDKFTHFATSLIFMYALTLFLGAWFNKSADVAMRRAAMLVASGGFAWELLEAFSDVVLGTELLGGGSGRVLSDTILDVVMNILGIIAASFLLKMKSNRKPA